MPKCASIPCLFVKLIVMFEGNLVLAIYVPLSLSVVIGNNHNLCVCLASYQSSSQQLLSKTCDFLFKYFSSFSYFLSICHIMIALFNSSIFSSLLVATLNELPFSLSVVYKLEFEHQVGVTRVCVCVCVYAIPAQTTNAHLHAIPAQTKPQMHKHTL